MASKFILRYRLAPANEAVSTAAPASGLGIEVCIGFGAPSGQIRDAFHSTNNCLTSAIRSGILPLTVGCALRDRVANREAAST